MTVRPYQRSRDYQRVYDFLVETYRRGESFRNWLSPRWEYMHYHPYIHEIPLERAGVAEHGGDIVGVAHPEHSLAYVYLQLRPGRNDAAPALVDWAEQNLGGRSDFLGRDVLGFMVHEDDGPLRRMLAERGYERSTELSEPNARYLLDRPVPEAVVPAGFRLQSLAEENDLRKINEVLWRGFNHEGEPPDEEIPGRAFMQTAPNFDEELTIVAVAPDGSYAAFAGMWVVPENRLAYVEPVATDPAYRRKGLGRAAVTEALRRARARGAEVAWVGSDQEFYLAMGFERMFAFEFWLRELG